MINKTILSICLLLSTTVFSQVGIGTTTPDPSAIVELKSSNQGFLLPRMTTAQRNAIQSPTEGLMVFNNERNTMQFFRENIGIGNNLSGWFDPSCTSDIAASLSSLPTGVILDFSDLSQNGLVYDDVDGSGNLLTATSPHGTNIGSIGPLPDDLNNLSGPQTKYISFIDRGETGNLSSEAADHKFILSNQTANNPNDYNASTFLARNGGAGSNGDRFSADYSSASYTSDYEIILVAKFNVSGSSSGQRASFFNLGGKFQLGNGNNSGECNKDYFMYRIVKSGNTFDFCGNPSANMGDDKRVSADDQFHRFRMKYTAATQTVEMFMDGNPIGVSNGRVVDITRFDFFNNRTQTSAPDASISFFAFYNAHLQQTDIDNFNTYLACKFELQP